MKAREVFFGKASPNGHGLSDDQIQAAVRAASMDLYAPPTGGFGAWPVVPDLTLATMANRKTSQGQPVDLIADNPMLLGPLWRIAFRMGALPIKVFTVELNGERKEAPLHPAYRLLRNPNPSLTRSLMISGTIMTALLYGQAAWVDRKSVV